MTLYQRMTNKYGEAPICSSYGGQAVEVEINGTDESLGYCVVRGDGTVGCGMDAANEIVNIYTED